MWCKLFSLLPNSVNSITNTNIMSYFWKTQVKVSEFHLHVSGEERKENIHVGWNAIESKSSIKGPQILDIIELLVLDYLTANNHKAGQNI